MGTIAFVTDERLSRQRSAILTRSVNALRSFAKVELLDGSIDEEQLLSRLEQNQYNLVLVPWYRYLNWSKVEGFYGLTRTTGPTFAGYFCESLMPYEIGEQADHYRAILLDFAHLEVNALRSTVKALMVDTRRSGLRPLLHAATPVYCDAWMGGLSLGSVLDSALSVPELRAHDWQKRLACYRACVSSLWSLIYEEGPGKAELGLARASDASRTPRAFFQVAIDPGALVLRLYFNMPAWTPRDALRAFWPNAKSPLSPFQELCRYADFVRVHTVPEPADVEVTIALFPEAPAQNAFGQIHTLWIEPLAAHVIQELPFDVPGAPPPPAPELSLLRPFPGPTPAPAEITRGGDGGASADKARRFVLEAADKVRELKAQLEDREETIRELRAGGVGTASPLPPPDMEGILDAFQEKYYEAKFQIEEFEAKIAQMENEGTTREEVEGLRRRMIALANREQAWLKKIAATLATFRKKRAQASGE